MVFRSLNKWRLCSKTSDPYKRMLLAAIAGILAEQADREKPSFEEAIDRIVKAIMIDENTLQNRLGIKKAP